jgi:F420-non-reducing hydrogenase small subunit
VSKLKLALEDFALCGGCEIALADLGEGLLKVLDEDLDLVYAPVLASTRDYDSADVTLLIGAIRNQHDLERLKEARKKSKILVAFGTCPGSGGLVGLANLYGRNDLVKSAYPKEGDHTDERSKKLLEKLEPAYKHVKVDYIIPGCPPPGPVIKQMLRGLLGGK